MKKVSALIAVLFIALVAQTAKAESCAPHFMYSAKHFAKVLPLQPFGLTHLMYSAKRFAKEAANFVMEHGGINLPETLSGTSKGAHFCGGEGEPPEGCSFDEALEHYKASPEDASFLEGFVGRVKTQRKDGKSYSSTGFIVRTERCAANNLIFTNAHTLFNRKKGEPYAKNSKFCLKGKCYELDLGAISKMEKQGLLGKKKILTGADRADDYIVLPIKSKKKPAPKRAARLASFEKDHNFDTDIMFAGYHIKNKRVRFVQGCKIINALEKNPLTILHNCPGRKGFSGGPLINSKNEIVAFHASSGKKEGQPYDPPHDSFNMGGGISQEFIDNLNRYCSDSN